MTRIAPDVLSNTLNLIQLARETAQARGNTAQAQRLAPVADSLHNIVTSEQRSAADSPAPVGGIAGQSDFQFLLRASKSQPAAGPAPASQPMERTQVVGAMASAGMGLTDIARHMGMTQDEVRLILDVSQKARSTGAVR
jgi:hypothetical protein